jgi:aryl-phospho-beta-D-glucosidase BglC (GH1 family)
METDFQPVTLRGLNRSGLEYHKPDRTAHLHHAGFTREDFDRVAEWGGNLIRLPFNQSWALDSPGYDSEPYLRSIDNAVAMYAERGAYTLLDLHWIDAVRPRGLHSDGRANFVPPLPDQNSIRVWSQLARRYRNENAVLFDIFNEPHDALPNDSIPLHTIDVDGSLHPLRSRRVRMKIWQSWAIHLVNAIRAEHPTALIVVSGIDWGFDLRGFPIPGVRDLIYSSHVYPHKHHDWHGKFGHLAEHAPVLVAEFGGCDEDVEWGYRLLSYMEESKMSWAAWSWADRPLLVQRELSYRPTAFGHLVRAALKRTKEVGIIQG